MQYGVDESNFKKAALKLGLELALILTKKEFCWSEITLLILYLFIPNEFLHAQSSDYLILNQIA